MLRIHVDPGPNDVQHPDDDDNGRSGQPHPSDLEAAGAAVADLGEGIDTDPFGEGNLVCVNGDTVRVYAFETAAERTAFTDTISPDGFGVGGGQYEWVAAPGVWARGNVMVFTLGASGETQAAIEAVMGSRIAGSDTSPEIRDDRIAEDLRCTV
jgi:hypothetical protein